jgi:hypothetical protein
MKLKNLITQNSFGRRFSSITKIMMSLVVLLAISKGVSAQNNVNINMTWVSSTSTTADFDVYLTNTGTSTLKFNGIVFRGNHAGYKTIVDTTAGTSPSFSWQNLSANALTTATPLTAGGTVGNTWNSWPGAVSGTNLPYTTSTGQLNYSSASAFFTSTTAPTIPTAAQLTGGVKVGRFRFTVANGTFKQNALFGFVYASTASVIAYVGTATTTTSLAIAGTNKTVTTSGTQTLNPFTGYTATMSGTTAVCAGSSANISVTMSGGTSPYTLVYGDGTNSYTVNSYVSGSSISVTPNATSNYTITSVSDAGSVAAATTTGTATVTVNQPTPSLSVGAVTASANQTNGTTVVYKNNCDLVGKIVDAAGGNVLGSTSMTATLASTNFQGGLYNFMYCKRTFTASPASNGAGVVTIYMTPSDFTDYNTNKPSWMSALPTSALDPNLANVRVARESGGVYTNVFLAASSFTWNALGYWELQVSVSSVSGNFYVTSTPDCANQEVTGLSATTLSGTQVSLSWNAITGYGWFQIQRRTNSPQGAWIASGSTQLGATSATVSGLAYATAYDFRVVRVCSPTSLGNWTSAVTATTNALPCSFAPSSLSVPTVGITSATANWTAVAGSGWYGVRYRAVTAGNTGTWTTITSSTLSKVLTGLTGNTLYEVQVKTFCTNANAGVSSDWTASTQFTTMVAPPTPCSLAPTGLQISAITATTATASWNAVAGAGWYGFKYRVQNLVTPNAWISSTTGATTRNLTGLVNGTLYEVSVKTFCNNNNTGLSSDWSDSTFNFRAGLLTRSIATTELSSDFSVYPNPTTDELNIDVVMDNETMTTIKVMDMSGRVVKQIEASTIVGQNKINISLAELTAGLYTIQVINNDKLMHVTRVSKN